MIEIAWGNDTVNANAGVDFIDGGAGWDTVDYRYSDAAVYVDLYAGRGTGASNSGSDGDTLISIGEVNGSRFNDTLKAGSRETVLSGEEANDILHGGNVVTRMYGGEGQDTFVLASLSNRADGGNGDDTASFYKLGSGIRHFPPTAFWC